MLKKLKPMISNDCISNEKKRKNVIKKLNNISRRVNHYIKDQPRVGRLTKIYDQFQPGEITGCSNEDSVSKIPDVIDMTITEENNRYVCSVKRNHFRQQNPGQRYENITYESDGSYNLTVGE